MNSDILWGCAGGLAVVAFSYLLFRTVFSPKKLAQNKLLGVSVPIAYALVITFFLKATSRINDVDVRVAIFILAASCFFSLFKFLLLPLAKEIQKSGN